jgi:hypothetical protein
MSDHATKEIQLEIGHVLFIDIVGYSKLLIDEQRDYLHTLRRAWRNSGKASNRTRAYTATAERTFLGWGGRPS